jgi:hypothetical protein
MLPAWQTPVKKIVKSLVVVDPAFCSKVRLLSDKKEWIFVVVLKVNQRKMVLLDEGGKLPVKLLAG